MEDYLKQFVYKFIEEANGLLSQLETELLEIEADEATDEHLETIFRVMHTLKGTAGMYGFENIQNLTHHLETVYDRIRENSMQFNQQILELTLIAVDHIKNLLQDDKLEKQENIDRQKGLKEQVLKIISTPSPNIGTRKASAEKEQNEPLLSTFYIKFLITEHLMDRGISLLNIFRELSGLGKYSVVKNFPPETQNPEDSLWGIYLITEQNEDAIAEVFVFVEENVTVRKIADINLFDNKEFSERIALMSQATDELQAGAIQQSILELVEEKYKVAHKPQPAKNEKTVGQKVRSIDSYKNNESSRVSVDAGKLDVLMHLVTELVTTQSQFSLAIQKSDLRSLREVFERTQKLTKQFRDNTLDIRMVPLGDVLIRFRRLIRDLSKQLGKKVDFITEGMETELDKSMIDSLTEPLLHLLRNCLDHGIETPQERKKQGKPEKGKIQLTAQHSGGYIFIKVIDDGAGIDIEKIKEKGIAKKMLPPGAKITESEAYDLIFKPGFSTVHTVTEVSGRGVGMDIVRRRITDIRGEVEVSSKRHVHTTFTIKLQPTIAIIDTMLVRVEDTFCLIPISDIEICNQISSKELQERRHLQTIAFDGTPTPYIDLRSKLSLAREKHPPKAKLVFVNLQGTRFAVVVDKIIGEHQAVLKPLGEEFQNQQYISSASTLGDGSLAFMLDMNNLYADVEAKSLEKTI